MCETRDTYDAANRLTKVELYRGGGYTVLSEASYNGNGERVSLTTYALGQAETTTYFTVKGELLMTSGAEQARYHLFGNGLVGEQVDGQWHYFLHDGQASVRTIVDGTGEVVSQHTYRPFGGALHPTGSYEGTFGFLGAQVDRLSGLNYINGRYYDPVTGRFLTPAHHAPNPYSPLSLLLVPGLGFLLWRSRRRWRAVVVVAVLSLSGLLVSCSGGGTPPPTVPPPPTIPPIGPPPSNTLIPPTGPSIALPPSNTPIPPTDPWTPTPPPPPSNTPTPTSTPCPTPSPQPTPSDDDVIATARAAALETGGIYLWPNARDSAISAISSIVHNRVNVTGFNCSTAAACASDTSQFQAVSRDPNYQPTEREKDIARNVLNGPRGQGLVGEAVFFHDFTAKPGPVFEYNLASATPGYGFYFYTTEQCPGGPRGGGVGCSFVEP